MTTEKQDAARSAEQFWLVWKEKLGTDRPWLRPNLPKSWVTQFAEAYAAERVRAELQAYREALRHGKYLATSADNYLNERNKFDESEELGDGGDSDALSDHFRGLRSAIYVFRKRAEALLAKETK